MATSGAIRVSASGITIASFGATELTILTGMIGSEDFVLIEITNRSFRKNKVKKISE